MYVRHWVLSVVRVAATGGLYNLDKVNLECATGRASTHGIMMKVGAWDEAQAAGFGIGFVERDKTLNAAHSLPVLSSSRVLVDVPPATYRCP